MVILDGQNLTIEQFIAIVRNNKKVMLSEAAKSRVNEANRALNQLLKAGKTIYGVNTGFGKLCDQVISGDDLHALQVNLLKSHACGIGPSFDREIVRGMMLLRINALLKGYSGIRLIVIEQLVNYLNHGITPIVPSQGSLGASGDLAPLSHMALTLIGLGEVIYQNKMMPSLIALTKLGLKPLSHLEAKEGLSLINGTQAMTSIAGLALNDSLHLLKTANLTGALSLEALRGIIDAFDQRLHNARLQTGQIKMAEEIRSHLKGSTYITKQGELRVQDAYSLRCMAQVHGASYDAINHIKEIIEREMNAATDNPLLFDGHDFISGGNFHGQAIALAMDYLKIAMAEIANISERRIERLVNPQLSEGLPAFLVAKPGLNSGFMIVQYAAASLVSENKVLSHPASVDSIPSSANQEDHVSMGTIAARGVQKIIENTTKVLAMELFTSCQAIDLRAGGQLGCATEGVYDLVRKEIPFLKEDEIMYPYLERAIKIVKSQVLTKTVSK